jgi:hypothetical protein
MWLRYKINVPVPCSVCDVIGTEGHAEDAVCTACSQLHSLSAASPA